MDNFELEFEGKLSPETMKAIDELVDLGFDPEKELRQKQENLQEQERKSNLLLPASCMPKIGEVEVAPGQLGEETSIADIEAYLEKLILDLPPSSTFLIDFRHRNYLIAAEIVLSRLKAHLEANYIRYILTPESRQAVMRAQQESWRAKAEMN